MNIEIGSVVISKAGRDKGYFLFVKDMASDGVLVCDGKERPIERPKKKNPKHLAPTGYSLSAQETATNRSLKRALSKYGVQAESEVE